MQPATEATIERVRSLCLALPRVVESGGEASGVGALSGTRVVGFKVSGRVVARVFVVDPGGREDVLLWFRPDPVERAVLLESGRGFLRAGPRDLMVTLDAGTDWTELAELVTDSYLLVAPKKLAAEVETSIRVSPPAYRSKHGGGAGAGGEGGAPPRA